ncbi:hypothetical protein V5799_013419 [Amblyomma americanum]|uniref:Uncharacterized protein n=1 Tax=Amblyomma americanum TaxID=6943 RepID=A0AAQ4E601_AMBAM
MSLHQDLTFVGDHYTITTRWCSFTATGAPAVRLAVSTPLMENTMQASFIWFTTMLKSTTSHLKLPVPTKGLVWWLFSSRKESLITS